MKIRLSFLFLILFSQILFAQSDKDFPEKPSPARLVNDLTGSTLTTYEIDQLESKLRRLNDTSSTQMAIVIIHSTGEYATSDYATRLGKKWGIGQEGKNNGLLLLVALDDHKYFTSIGYGLEGILPDGKIRLLEEKFLKPNFINKEYYKGLDEVTTAFAQLAAGEYKADEEDDSSSLVGGLIFLFIFGIIIYAIFRAMRGGGGNRGGGGLPFMIFGGGGGYSGGSDFGGGGGGFDFGGGDFGGGGAGGDW